MGLSTRILLRICLPSAGLILGLGVTYHYATREQHVAAAQGRLQQAATAIAEIVEYRCDGIALQLTGILADDGTAAAARVHPDGATPASRSARAALAEELRLVLDRDPRLLRLDVHSRDGAGIARLDRGGELGVPPPAGDEDWFVSALQDGRFESWADAPDTKGVTRVSVGLPSADVDAMLVGTALVDFERFVLPIVHSASQGLGPVRMRVEGRSGRIRFGPTTFDPAEQLLRAQAEVACFGGRVHLEQRRDQVLAGLLTFERDAFVVSMVLIICVAALLWTGMRALVLSPLRGMLATIEAFEAGKPIPPPARGRPPTGELAVLDDTLRKAFDASTEGRKHLQDLNNSLEARVRERTAELEHNANALRLARDDAARANEAKSSFVANVSHEVRTPLNAIIGMTGMLAETRLDEDQAECVETVRQAGENLLALINHVLDFSKIEAGRLELEHIDFDLSETLHGVVSLLGPSARQKGLELGCEIPTSCPARLRGDPTRLRQVLVNLVGNAVKFTQSGSVRITAALEPDGALWTSGSSGPDAAGAPSPGSQDGRTPVRFEVSDTGIGIAPEAQARLFAPFSQAEQSTARQFGGTGLGLAICKQIVERMGGRIGVRSEPGRGSTFWCVVPFEARPAQELVGGAPAAQRWELSGLRVLVASFQPASRRLLEQTLAACGTSTDTASTPEDALHLAQQAFTTGQGFHAALVDENLPGGGPTGLARAFRTDPALARTPLLLMSREDDPDGARAAGFDLSLAKPVNTVHLVDAVCTAIAGAADRSPARSPRPTVAPPPAPAAAAPAGRPERTERGTTAPVPADAPPPSGRRGRLLVAEDNPVNQRVATRVLEKLGFQVDVVGDGAAAVDAVARGGYDAVLMDLQMPVMDGYEATRRIRSAETDAARVPIIALTAHAMAGDRERALHDGLDDYVCKPVRPTDLAAVLDRWLGGAAEPPDRTPPRSRTPEDA